MNKKTTGNLSPTQVRAVGMIHIGSRGTGPHFH
jgi:hypothetical protein